jgi:hypothetical protein
MEEWQRLALEVAERDADSRAMKWELAAPRATVEESLKPARTRAANEAAEKNPWGIGFYYTFQPERAALDAVDWHLDSDTNRDCIPLREPFRHRAAWGILLVLGWVLGARGDGLADVARCYSRQAWLSDLLRDIFGNPFNTRGMDLDWLSCNQGSVRQLAQVVYGERLWEDLPVLADALEEAGCDNADILGHLRGPGPHVRGCWAVDLLLDKE